MELPSEATWLPLQPHSKVLQLHQEGWEGPGSWVLKTGDQHLCSGGGPPFLTPSPPLPLLSLSHPRTESQLVVSHSFHFPQKPWFSNTFSCSLPGLVLQQDFWA